LICVAFRKLKRPPKSHANTPAKSKNQTHVIILPPPPSKPALHTGIVVISSPLRLGPDVLQGFPYMSKRSFVSIDIMKGSDVNSLDVYNLEVALDFLRYVLDVLSIRDW
jgi:hypothetical protein